MDNKRPLRDAVEGGFDSVPSGPLGKAGEGDVVGAAGFLAVESSRPLIEFVPGVKQPGYKVTAHGTEPIEGGTRHTLTVEAVSEDVAEFVAQYSASPSNVDFLSSELDLVGTEVVNEKPTYSTYRITVDNTNANKWARD